MSAEERVEDNKIRLAEKDIRIYLGQCDKKLNKYPEAILSFGETFAEKGRTIVSILSAIGVKVHESNINKVSGNLRFEKKENTILNKKTGNRENRGFYEITIKKLDNINPDDVKEYEYESLEKSKKIKEEECSNELKISDNSLDFYLGQCNLDFQSHDQLILSTTEENIEMLKYIIKILNPLGIQVDDEFITDKKIIFHSSERERINPNTGRKERKIYYKLGITKVPELYMYTNLKDAIEVHDDEE